MLNCLHDELRVDDRRIVSAIIFVNKNGLRWRDTPRTYGPHKTICNRFIPPKSSPATHPQPL